MVISEDQQSDFLTERAGTFLDYQIVDQDGLEWVVITTSGGIVDSSLLLDNCNLGLLTQLKQGDVIRRVQSIMDTPIGVDGNYGVALALVSCENGILYCSPGFDLEQYNARNRPLSTSPVES